MQAKKRYTLTLSLLMFILMCYILRSRPRRPTPSSPRSSWRTRLRPNISYYASNASCSMASCFDFSLPNCQSPSPRHHVYPTSPSNLSSTMTNVLRLLMLHPLYTPEPGDACIFFLRLDTLDRDPLSQTNFVADLHLQLEAIKKEHEHIWNEGRNHVVLNLYSGTYPDYSLSDLHKLQIGKAILAQASTSLLHYRLDFDISLPLFHPTHPIRSGQKPLRLSPDEVDYRGLQENWIYHAPKSLLLAFKGKRYVYGQGSETRNGLHHLHNGEDVVLLTTCRHGRNWQALKDRRCDEDNELYDKWDYEHLLSSSSFCLVPRGRRLGSFRFLESLESACIPVILANEWQLPFAELVDWDQVGIRADENLLFQVSDALRDVDENSKQVMRRETQKVYHKYLNSVERIIDTVLEIIHLRIRKHLAISTLLTAQSPQIALESKMFSSLSLTKDDFTVPKTFVAVIDCSDGHIEVDKLSKIIKTILRSQHLEKLVFLWPNSSIMHSTMSSVSSNIPDNFPVHHSYIMEISIISAAFANNVKDFNVAVYIVHHTNSKISSLDKMFVEFQEKPWQLLGSSRALHFYNIRKEHWAFSSSLKREYYSMIMLDNAFYHGYYTLFFEKSMKKDLEKVAKLCPHIVFNVILSDFLDQSPILFNVNHEMKDDRRGDDGVANFLRRQKCMKLLSDIYGDRIPLRYNRVNV